MTTTVERPVDLPRDEPEAYIARDRRWALATHRDMPDRVSGSALFADISGFTPLTEALGARRPPASRWRTRSTSPACPTPA